MNPHDAHYPFAALVGQEPLRTALLLGAVDPSLGGVLIRGEKGTAKSTAARALARLLPTIRVAQGCPYRCDPDHPWPACPSCSGSAEIRPAEDSPSPHVDLPLGATEDRVLGTLDLERVLKDGRATLKPGLLAQAHRGVLYIDEVNLLPDHLVDALLDVSTSGVNSVQRDGVSARHPARFLLVGSMNPEEGELRPQLLDRFGLMVEVAAPRDPETRAEVVRRRLEFEADPIGFSARWAADDRALGDRVAGARSRLAGVAVADGLLTAIARLCAEAQVDGLRADIALYKAARALAALDGRPSVRRNDLRDAAEFVLPHRRRRRPFQQPGLDRDAIDRALGPDEGREEGSEASTEPAPTDSQDQEGPEPSDGEERVIDPGEPVATPRLEPGFSKSRRPAPPGTHPARAASPRGAYVRAVAEESPRELAVDATLRASALRGGGLAIERGDLHGKRRAERAGTLVLFVVDTSGSMGARRRMEAVKAAVLGLLGDAYKRRDRVAVIAFRGPHAEVVLEPTRGVERADEALRRLPTGGRTPLAHALTLASQVIETESRNGPALLVLLTDGRANVPLPSDSPSSSPLPPGEGPGVRAGRGTGGAPFPSPAPNGSATVPGPHPGPLPGGEGGRNAALSAAHEGNGDPWDQALAVARAIGESGTPAVVFDTEEGFGRLGRASELAEAMGADRLPLAGLSADEVRSRVDPPEVGP